MESSYFPFPSLDLCLDIFVTLGINPVSHHACRYTIKAEDAVMDGMIWAANYFMHLHTAFGW